MNVEFEAVLTHASQRTAGMEYRRVSGQRYLPVDHCREQWQVELGAKHHPRGVLYWAPAAARAVAHTVERPGAVVGGFSALALYGLPFLVEGADTLLFCATAARSAVGGEHSPTVRRPSRAPVSTWQLHHRGVALRAAAPADAVVQALQQVKKGEHRWGVVDVAGRQPSEIMALQLVDCARRFLGLSVREIQVAARGKLDSRWLKSLLASSSCRADSPKETEMRLLVTALADRYGYTVEEQVPLIVDGKVVTVFDLAIPELKIAIMYDGAHHLEWKQRKKDSSITIKMTMAGWTPARCASETMFECIRLIEGLMQKSSAGQPG
ncbi:hypothetical protein [Corynebacterium fournieri]|uniref:hypothetical protein n=2 Tax=Corynebacterium fournieri TaxID=1852390 RepID=UPI000A2F4883|nr:hypothetical protein [Corynebacterium fournieri]